MAVQVRTRRRYRGFARAKMRRTIANLDSLLKWNLSHPEALLLIRDRQNQPTFSPSKGINDLKTFLTNRLAEVEVIV